MVSVGRCCKHEKPFYVNSPGDRTGLSVDPSGPGVVHVSASAHVYTFRMYEMHACLMMSLSQSVSVSLYLFMYGCISF